MAEAPLYRLTLTWPRVGRWLPGKNGYLPYLICPLRSRYGRPVEAKVADAIETFRGTAVTVKALDLRPRTVVLTVAVTGRTRRPKNADWRGDAAATWLSQAIDGDPALPEPVRIQVAATTENTPEVVQNGNRNPRSLH